jgi:hypothetical protein
MGPVRGVEREGRRGREGSGGQKASRHALAMRGRGRGRGGEPTCVCAEWGLERWEERVERWKVRVIGEV